MIWRRILLINLPNRCQRFDSDARHQTLKDTGHCITKYKGLPIYFISFNFLYRCTTMEIIGS